jgi:hypothetical protein
VCGHASSQAHTRRALRASHALLCHGCCCQAAHVALANRARAHAAHPRAAQSGRRSASSLAQTQAGRSPAPTWQTWCTRQLHTGPRAESAAQWCAGRPPARAQPAGVRRRAQQQHVRCHARHGLPHPGCLLQLKAS